MTKVLLEVVKVLVFMLKKPKNQWGIVIRLGDKLLKGQGSSIAVNQMNKFIRSRK